MPSSGPNYAGTCANDTAPIGGANWTSPTNAQGNQVAVFATSARNASNFSFYLKATNYGFAIPANAVIDGILVEVDCKASGASCSDTSVKLYKAGSIVGTEHANNNQINTVLGYAATTYGGSADLWGTTWTPSDINNSGFGIGWSWVNNTKENSRTVSVANLRITVTYHIARGAFLMLLTQ